jgi:hypothetical protein
VTVRPSTSATTRSLRLAIAAVESVGLLHEREALDTTPSCGLGWSNFSHLDGW